MDPERLALYRQLLAHAQLLNLGAIIDGTPVWDIRNWRTAWMHVALWHENRWPRTTADLLELEIDWQRRLIAIHGGAELEDAMRHGEMRPYLPQRGRLLADRHTSG